jgi:tRNA pseudouridine38-40 synthase
VRIRAVVAYDGTGYGGYQIQQNAPTIQAEIEGVLERLTKVQTRIVAAGRTDAGVHARGQVVAFDTAWTHPVAELQRGMNALLPEQIAVRRLAVADPGFHPRFDAVSRSYRYTIDQSAVRDPMSVRYALHCEQPLDLNAMVEASRYLIGRHDFSAFGSPPQGSNAVRDVTRAGWSAQALRLYFDIEANAFLYRMVRMLVGTLLRVGRGALKPGEFSEILETQDRDRAGPAAIARGLSLESVTYADGWRAA